MANLLNKNFFLRTLIVLSILEILSLLAYSIPEVNLILLPLFIIASIFLLWRHNEFLLYLPLAEIAWGSLGRTFYWHVGSLDLSLRMIIFALVIIIWLIKRPNLKLIPWRQPLFWSYATVIIFLIWGSIQGILRHHGLGTVFADGNGYIFIIYGFIWLTCNLKWHWTNILSLLAAAATMVSLKTLIIFHIFTHAYEWANISYLYLWVRDTKVGELTLVTASYWRVFLQSQIYPLLLWLMTTMLVINSPKPKLSKKIIFLSALWLTTVIVSLSRSFWLALAVSIIIFVFLQIKNIWKQRFFLQRLKVIGGTLVLGCSIILVTLFVPPLNADLSAALANRFGRGEAAATSRANLLPVMIKGIQKDWLTGAGFGATLTYKNNDPRVRDLAHRDGSYTTYAFEFGWLDFWFKLGIVGLIAWVGLIGLLALKLLSMAQNLALHKPQLLAVAAAITCLAVVHAVTPYLNHPLGLGFISLVFAGLLRYEQTHS